MCHPCRARSQQGSVLKVVTDLRGYLCNRSGVDRTSSGVPKSVLCLSVDKGQGLRSGLLFFTSLVLLPIESGDKS